MRVDAFCASDKATIVKIPRKKMLSMLESNTYLNNMLSQRSLFRTNVHAIAGNPVFQVLPLKLSQHLARCVILRQFGAGHLICTLNEPSKGIDIILHGDACYIASDKHGQKFKLPPLPSKSLIGDLTLKGNKSKQIAEVIAHTKVSLAHIPFGDLLNVSVAFPPLKERLIKHADHQQIHIMQGIATANKK